MDNAAKEELLAYAIKMFERGDSYADIITYLNKKGADDSVKKEILIKLDEHKKTIVKAEKKLYPVSAARIAFGLAFFALTLYLEYLGFIYFPWSIIGYLTGALALFEIFKIILNLFKK